MVVGSFLEEGILKKKNIFVGILLNQRGNDGYACTPDISRVCAFNVLQSRHIFIMRLFIQLKTIALFFFCFASPWCSHVRGWMLVVRFFFTPFILHTRFLEWSEEKRKEERMRYS